MDLAADGRMGQVQLLGRRHDAPLFRHNPKIQEVVVVEPFHGQRIGPLDAKYTAE
jgi:hypothetical protein